MNRRLALNKWYRKSIAWEPVWFNSSFGNMQLPLQINCWGRTENIGGKDQLTALTLRGENKKSAQTPGGYDWLGRWAVISQDDSGISEARQIAVVPFDTGFISIPLQKKPFSIEKVSIDGSEAFQAWKWENNNLVMTVDESLLNKTAGFLIKIQQQ
jgi:hypothetical protein